jgi:hypothetical protein
VSVSEGAVESSEKRSTPSNLPMVSEKVRDGLSAWTVWMVVENQTGRVIEHADLINQDPAGGEIIKNTNALFAIG